MSSVLAHSNYSSNGTSVSEAASDVSDESSDEGLCVSVDTVWLDTDERVHI